MSIDFISQMANIGTVLQSCLKLGVIMDENDVQLPYDNYHLESLTSSLSLFGRSQ